MIRVFIIDDHKMVIQGMKLILQEAEGMSCIGYALSGADGLRQLKDLKPDVILLDINMPGMTGIEVCKAVHSKYSSIKILGLTMLKEISLIKQMLKSGAMGYLLKNSGKKEVINAIHSVVKGERYLDKEVNDLLIKSIAGNIKTNKNPFPSLTSREKEVLELIVNEKTTQEIAIVLGISFSTVEVHRRNMLIKLGARNTAGLVRLTYEYNLLD